MRQRSHPRARWASPLLAVLLGSLIATALLELALRIHSPIRSTVRGGDIVLPVHQHVVRVNPRADSKLDPVIETQYNGLGFRGPPPPADFSDPLTIVTVGGSTTACTFLADGKTWPDLLAAHLRGELGDVWLNNAGFDGHSTFGHRKLLDTVLAPLRPDYVLYLVGINDVGRTEPRGTDLAILPSAGWRSTLRRLGRRSELLGTLEALARQRWAARRGLGNAELDLAHVSPLRESPEEWNARVREHAAVHIPAYEARLRDLVRATRDAGIRPILVTQTLLAGDHADARDGSPLGGLAFKPDMSTGLAGHLLGMYNEATKRIAAEEGIPVVDLADGFPIDSRYYYDWMHYTNEGATLVAERIARDLVPLLTADGSGA